MTQWRCCFIHRVHCGTLFEPIESIWRVLLGSFIVIQVGDSLWESHSGLALTGSFSRVYRERIDHSFFIWDNLLVEIAAHHFTETGELASLCLGLPSHCCLLCLLLQHLPQLLLLLLGVCTLERNGHGYVQSGVSCARHSHAIKTEHYSS